MRKIIEEFGIFSVAFLVILVIMRLFTGNTDMISYSNITLIFVLSLINIIIRHGLIIAKDKYNMTARNFDFIRRMSLIGMIAIYFYFKH